MAGFAEYYAQALERNKSLTRPTSTPRRQSPPPTSDVGGYGFAGNGSADKPQDPLSWIVDILSRPLYGVTEQFDSILDTAAEAPKIAEKAKTDPLGAAGDFLAGVGRGATAGARGLFSTSRDDKRTTSELIEKTTDTIGGRVDPKYVDEQDNVNPILKGTLGFAGDVAADPLTYLTFGVAPIVKGLTKGAKAIQTGAKGAVDAVRGEGAAESAVQALSRADEAEELVPTSPELADLADEGAALMVDRTPETPAVPRPPAEQQVPTPETLQAASTPASIREQIVDSPRAPRVRSFLDDLDRDDLVPRATAAEAGAVKVPTIDRWMKVMADKDPDKVIGLWLPPGARGGANLKEITHAKLPVLLADAELTPAKRKEILDAVTGEYDEWSEGYRKFHSERIAKEQADLGTPARPADAALKEHADFRTFVGAKADDFGRYRAGFRADGKAITWGKLQKELDDPATTPEQLADLLDIAYKAHVREIGPLSAAEESNELASRLARYSAMRDADRAAVEEVLGTRLSAALGRYGNPETFDRVTERLKEILDDGTVLDDILDNAKLSAPEKALMDFLRIDVAQTNQAMRETSIVTLPPTEVPGDIVKRMGGLSEEAEDVMATLPGSLRHFLDTADYTKVTKTGVLRTEEGLGQGLGKRNREFNGYDQANLFWDIQKPVVERISKSNAAARVPGSGGKVLGGIRRAAQVRDETLERLILSERILDTNGVPLWQGVGKDRVLLQTSQVLEILRGMDKALTNDAAYLVTDAAFWNASTRAAFTNVSDAVARIVNRPDTTVEELRDILLSTTKRNTKSGEVTNPLAKGGVYGAFPKGPKQRTAPKPPFGATLQQKGNAWLVHWPGDVLATKLALTIRESGDVLRTAVAANRASYIERFGAEAGDLIDDQIAKLEPLASDQTRMGEAIRAFDAADDDIMETAAQHGTYDASQQAATEVVRNSAPEGAFDNAATAVKTETIVRQGDELPDDELTEAGKANQQAQFNREADAADAASAKVEPTSAFANLGDKWAAETYRSINAGVMAKLDPLKKFFVAKHGSENLWNFWHSATLMRSTAQGQFRRDLSALAKTHSGILEDGTTPILVQAMRDVQRGVSSQDPRVIDAENDLRQAVAQIFDLGPDGSQLGNTFFRSNSGLSYLNSIMDLPQFRTGFQFDLAEAKAASRAAKAEGRKLSVREAAMDQWREWDIDDPLDFLDRMYGAGMKINTEWSVAQSFLRFGKQHDLVASAPKEGFVKLGVAAGQESTFAAFLPKGTYVAKELASEIHRLDEITRESRKLDGELGHAIHKYFDPIQNAWKFAITLPRPGHHVRNAIGDTSLTFVAEGTRQFKRAAEDAFKVMAVRNDYNGVDITKAMQAMDLPPVPKGGEVISSGRYGDLTADQIYEYASRHGLLPTYHVGEDYLDDVIEKSGVQKVADAVTFRGTKLEAVAGGVSTYRDHFSRLQHFLQIIHKQQSKTPGYGEKLPKDLDEMLDAAAKRVKRFHPDGSMLATGEAKYLRRLIPFYSWFRGALPAIVESTAAHPGRVLIFPKASYNLAVSLGVDPYSLSDPFPEDQLFPSFLTEQALGPVANIGGSYFGINPGIAHIDVANTLSDPVRGVAGMVSPLLRVPAELLAGGQWGTGAKINDTSDYIDSSIPGVNYLSNVTGQSVTGSLASLLGGGGLDPQYQHAAGNKDATDQALSALNWLTGVGLQDMSKPNYINYAEIEQRNRAAEGK